MRVRYATAALEPGCDRENGKIDRRQTTHPKFDAYSPNHLTLPPSQVRLDLGKEGTLHAICTDGSVRFRVSGFVLPLGEGPVLAPGQPGSDELSGWRPSRRP